MAANGVLSGDHVLVPEEREANVLYNKGAFGTPQSGGSTLLSLLDATFLAEQGRLIVKQGQRRLDAGALLEYAGSRDPDFDVRYIVYRDLRLRGFLVKQGKTGDEFHVFPRGGFPGKTPSSHVVLAVSERAGFDARALAATSSEAREASKRLLTGLVDEEGDLTYYEVDLVDLKGRMTPEAPDTAGLEGVLLADRVFVFSDAGRALLHDERHLGMIVGPALQLSLPEAVHLARTAGLRIRTHEGALEPEEVAERARAVEPAFDLRYAVYKDLSQRGLVPRTGFKFGCHFRAYRGDPDEAHAPYLVHALGKEYSLSWPEVAGFVRLSHGVRKEFVFALGPGEFLRLNRAKP